MQTDLQDLIHIFEDVQLLNLHEAIHLQKFNSYSNLKVICLYNLALV